MVGLGGIEPPASSVSRESRMAIQTVNGHQKIKPLNLVKFSSPESAIKAGYVPCKVCKPSMASN